MVTPKAKVIAPVEDVGSCCFQVRAPLVSKLGLQRVLDIRVAITVLLEEPFCYQVHCVVETTVFSRFTR